MMGTIIRTSIILSVINPKYLDGIGIRFNNTTQEIICVVQERGRSPKGEPKLYSWWMPPLRGPALPGGIHQLFFSLRDTHTLPSPSLFLSIYFSVPNIIKQYDDYQREREQFHTPNDSHYEEKSTCCSAICHCLIEVLENVQMS